MIFGRKYSFQKENFSEKSRIILYFLQSSYSDEQKVSGFLYLNYLHITFVDVYEENMTSRLYGTGKEKLV